MDNENKRTTKEYKIVDKQFPEMKIKYGTLDRNNPEIVYIRTKARITPIVKKKEYNDGVTSVKETFEKLVKSVVRNNSYFEDKHICSIEISENGIAFGKKSHIKYDVYVKPKEIKKLDEHETEIKSMVFIFNENLSNSLFANDIEVV